MPCSVLAQKIDFEIDDSFDASEDFAKVFQIQKILNSNEWGFENQGQQSGFQERSVIFLKSRDIGKDLTQKDTIIIQDEIDDVDIAEGEKVNNQSFRVCSVGRRFRVELKVKESFSKQFPSTLSEEQVYEAQPKASRPESKRKQVQMEMRCASRTLVNENNEEEVKEEHSTIPHLSLNEAEEIFNRALTTIVKGIRVHGWPLFRIPPSNSLIPIMNSSFIFQQKGFTEQKRDLDFLSALSLISGRKFIQACEIFRKLEQEILSQLNINKNDQQLIGKAIQLEILIADSMNQHSQLQEKIHAFQRAVELAQSKIIQNRRATVFKEMPMNDEEANKILLRLHPTLIQILIASIDSKIEAVKMAALRNIEFLLDQLGCSLGNHLILVLVNVIKSYPRSNNSNNFSTSLVLQNESIPKRLGFFQESTQSLFASHSHGRGPQEIRYDKAFENSFLNSVIFDLNDNQNLIIKDGLNFQTSYVSCIKNLQNHILESFLSLLSSMSSTILHQIFQEVILKCIFLQNSMNNPFESQLATDLRIYLLKFMDKIVTICQGDLTLNSQFLDCIIDSIYPSLILSEGSQKKSGTLGGNSMLNSSQSQASFSSKGLKAQSEQIENIAAINADIIKSKQKANQTISLACSNLWQTFKTKLFNNYSNKGLKQLIEWVTSKLLALFDEQSEENKFLHTYQISRLNLLLDLIDVITSNSKRTSLEKVEEDKNTDQYFNQLNLRGLIRANNQLNKPVQEQVEETIDINNQGFRRNQRNLVTKISSSLIILEFTAFINPLLLWLSYSMERPDRLSLFKSVWKSLTGLLRQLPHKKLELDLVIIILPALKKINNFCQTSSPPLEMLQFLIIVFSDFILIINDRKNPLRHRSKKQLSNFLDIFLVTVSKCIPHHLNEEIFLVCEQILELLLCLKQKTHVKEDQSQNVNSDTKMSELHISCMIDALTDKFTMRSKAHKRLQKFFLQRVVIEESYKQLKMFEASQNEMHRQEINQQNFQQIQRSMNNNDLVFSRQPFIESQNLLSHDGQYPYLNSQQQQPIHLQQLNQGLMSSSSAGGGGAPAAHRLPGGSGTVTMRHNNNDLGLVVNNDDVELSRDFAVQQHQRMAAVPLNNFEREGSMSEENYQIENEGENDEEGVEEEEGNEEMSGLRGNGIANDPFIEGQIHSSDVQDLQNEGVDYRNAYIHPSNAISQNIINNYEVHHQMLFDLQNQNQIMHEQSNQGFPHFPQQIEQQQNQVRRSIQHDIRLNIDIFNDLCFFKLDILKIASANDKHKEILNFEKFLEKLGIFIQLLKLLNSEQLPLFNRIIRRDQELQAKVMSIFVDTDDDLKHTAPLAIDIVETLSRYYMANFNAKYSYDYSIQTILKAKELVLKGENAQRHANQHNNNQHSQSSGNQQQQLQLQQHQQLQGQINQGTRNILHPHQQREIQGGRSYHSSNGFFSSSHPVLFGDANNQQLINQQNILRSTIHSQQNFPISSQQMLHRYNASRDQSQGVHQNSLPHPNQIGLPQNIADDDFIMDIDNLNGEVDDDDQIFADEVEVINSDRLVLIKLHMSLIKQASERYFRKQRNGETADVQMHFYALNLLDYLFANLLPVPSLFSMTMKQFMIASGRTVQLQQQPQQQRVMSHSVHSSGSEIGGGYQRESRHHGIGQRNLQAQTADGFYYDFEKEIIVDNQGSHSNSRQNTSIRQSQVRNQGYQVQAEQNPHAPPLQLECTDPIYLEGRIHYALKVWKIIEEGLSNSSWSTIKSISYGVMCQILRGISFLHRPRQQDHNKHIQKLKSLVVPLINKLLNSKESESKAGGLNIMGTICGLGVELGAPNYLTQFKFKDFMNIFRSDQLPIQNGQTQERQIIGGSRLITVSIWKKIFNLSQNDWDSTIRDAGTVLIQFCAPRSQILQFETLAKEKYESKIIQIINTFKFNNILTKGSQAMTTSEENKHDSYNPVNDSNQSSSSKSNKSSHSSSSSQNSSNTRHEERQTYDNAEDRNFEREYFFVDKYQEEQLIEILGIFKNDYKPPPKSLWVEKNGQTQSDIAQVGLENGQTNPSFIDIFEDRIVEKLNKIYGGQQQEIANENSNDKGNTISKVIDSFIFQKQKLDGQKDSGSKNTINESNNIAGDSEYLIFERHFDDKKNMIPPEEALKKNSSDVDSNSQGALDSANHDEDLGIIDLDELENQNGENGKGSDSLAFFDDQFDDDKLPVLKNTYTKKHRPNNSKSVAIGSRTQTIQIMNTSANQTQEAQKNSIAVKIPTAQQELKDKEQELGALQSVDNPNYAVSETILNKKSNSVKDLYQKQQQKSRQRFSQRSKSKEFSKDSSKQDSMEQKIEESKSDHHDKIIQKYEQQIALSIATLNTQLKNTSDHLNEKQFQEDKAKSFGQSEALNLKEIQQPLNQVDQKYETIQPYLSTEPQLQQSLSPSNNSRGIQLLKSRTPKDGSLSTLIQSSVSYSDLRHQRRATVVSKSINASNLNDAIADEIIINKSTTQEIKDQSLIQTMPIQITLENEQSQNSSKNVLKKAFGMDSSKITLSKPKKYSSSNTSKLRNQKHPTSQSKTHVKAQDFQMTGQSTTKVPVYNYGPLVSAISGIQQIKQSPIHQPLSIQGSFDPTKSFSVNASLMPSQIYKGATSKHKAPSKQISISSAQQPQQSNGSQTIQNHQMIKIQQPFVIRAKSQSYLGGYHSTPKEQLVNQQTSTPIGSQNQQNDQASSSSLSNIPLQYQSSTAAKNKNSQSFKNPIVVQQITQNPHAKNRGISIGNRNKKEKLFGNQTSSKALQSSEQRNVNNKLLQKQESSKINKASFHAIVSSQNRQSQQFLHNNFMGQQCSSFERSNQTPQYDNLGGKNNVTNIEQLSVNNDLLSLSEPKSNLDHAVLDDDSAYVQKGRRNNQELTDQFKCEDDQCIHSDELNDDDDYMLDELDDIDEANPVHLNRGISQPQFPTIQNKQYSFTSNPDLSSKEDYQVQQRQRGTVKKVIIQSDSSSTDGDLDQFIGNDDDGDSIDTQKFKQTDNLKKPTRQRCLPQKAEGQQLKP